MSVSVHDSTPSFILARLSGTWHYPIPERHFQLMATHSTLGWRRGFEGSGLGREYNLRTEWKPQLKCYKNANG